MDLTKEDNGLPTKVGIHGRSLAEDLERIGQDLDLQRAAAVFSRYPKVKSVSHFSEILKIPKEDALDRLEALQNLNLIEYSNGAYVALADGFVDLGVSGEKKERKIQHSNRLIQVASLVQSSDRFSDLRTCDCSSKEVINNLKSDLLKAFENFRESTKLLKAEDKDILLTLTLGYTEDDVNLGAGDNND